MERISLTIPGAGAIPNNRNLNSDLASGTIGSLVTEIASIAFLIAGFLMFIWFAWGVFEYIFAGGNKESLGKARKRMTWAIVGFIMFALSFFVSQYAQTIIPTTEKVTPVTPGTVTPGGTTP